MADLADITDERSESEMANEIQYRRTLAESQLSGYPGECFFCGEHFERVVPVVEPLDGGKESACGRCRDKHNLRTWWRK